MQSDRTYPAYEQIDLPKIGRIEGHYSLALLQALTPDCVWIWVAGRLAQMPGGEDYIKYEWLDVKIKEGLKQNKKVCVLINDELIISPACGSFRDCLNNYVNDPVWMVTCCDEQNQKIYSFQHGIQCKMLEIPWFQFNDCLAYERLSKRIPGSCTSQYNFLSMLGSPTPHKLDLVRELRRHGLDRFGLMTVRPTNEQYNKEYPKDLLEYCQINQRPPYPNINSDFLMGAESSHYEIDNLWVSANVENYLHLEECYADIPLMIHGETSVGIFINSEKSLWPLLLGKLMLVHGKFGTMSTMQRFYDVDFSTYADLTFDQYNNDYTTEGHRSRLKLLLDLNRPLIQDCKEIYLSLRSELERARWNIGRRMYAFVVEQLKTIK